MDKLHLIDFEKYTITKDGRVFSKRFNRFIKTSPSSRGSYVPIYLRCVDGKSRNYYLHRVVWFYFNGDIPEDLVINHIDEDKSNNSLDNLELLSRPDNIRYGTRTERAAKANSITQKGKSLSETHLANIRKASAKRGKPVLQYNLETNEPIKVWKSASEAAREVGFNRTHIRQCCNGGFFEKKGKWVNVKQHSGYGWKYV